MEKVSISAENGVSTLVDVRKHLPTIIVDILYATANNFLGFPIYTLPLCFVHLHMAKALQGAQNELEKMGLGLKIFDGYRPLSTQQVMWDKVQDPRYVSNPAEFLGAHIRAAAVDVTLVDANGEELEMPSGFDEFTERSHLNYMGGSIAALENRQLLQTVMKNQGLEPIDTEWWHFSLPGWLDDEKYPPLSISFEELENL